MVGRFLGSLASVAAGIIGGLLAITQVRGDTSMLWMSATFFVFAGLSGCVAFFAKWVEDVVDIRFGDTGIDISRGDVSYFRASWDDVTALRQAVDMGRWYLFIETRVPPASLKMEASVREDEGLPRRALSVKATEIPFAEFPVGIRLRSYGSRWTHLRRSQILKDVARQYGVLGPNEAPALTREWRPKGR